VYPKQAHEISVGCILFVDFGREDTERCLKWE
jgi:hypothetical protein